MGADRFASHWSFSGTNDAPSRPMERTFAKRLPRICAPYSRSRGHRQPGWPDPETKVLFASDKTVNVRGLMLPRVCSDSTIRYLGIEVGDALATAGQADV